MVPRVRGAADAGGLGSPTAEARRAPSAAFREAEPGLERTGFRRFASKRHSAYIFNLGGWPR
jgi:hypothetical protein